MGNSGPRGGLTEGKWGAGTGSRHSKAPRHSHTCALSLASWWNRGNLSPSGKASPPPGLGITSRPQELGSFGGSLPTGANLSTHQNSLVSPTLITCHWPPPQATGLLKTIYTWFCISSPFMPSPWSWVHCHENYRRLCWVLPQGRRGGVQNQGHLWGWLSPFVTVATIITLIITNKLLDSQLDKDAHFNKHSTAPQAIT